jgi:hypothetical protein
LGAATFFLPCGFTQALQFYVLAQGSFTIGALTMLAFSLGTLPALLSLSVMSSLVTGNMQRHFLKFAGAMVIVLGIANIKYGLVLTGSNMNIQPLANTMPATATSTPSAPIGDKQIIVMHVEGFDYIPNQFVVRQGVPVEWRIDASAAAGCGRILFAPGFGIEQLLSDRSTTTITFIPKATGEFGFNCGMGMMTPDSKFTVIPNSHG